MGENRGPGGDPLKEITVDLEYVVKAIDGDTRAGHPGLRERIRVVENQVVEAELDELVKRLEGLEEKVNEKAKEWERLSWRLAMFSGVLKWLGPSGVMLIIGFVAYVVRSQP